MIAVSINGASGWLGTATLRAISRLEGNNAPWTKTLYGSYSRIHTFVGLGNYQIQEFSTVMAEKSGTDVFVNLAFKTRDYIKKLGEIEKQKAEMEDQLIEKNILLLDKEEKYLGCTSVHQLLSLVSSTGSIKERGAILVLEINQVDYSLAQIAQIVESNDAKILSSFIMSSSDSSNIEVTLKINKIELDRIIRTFERYDYIIKATFQKGNYEDDLQFRFDALMNYLNL